jgi:acyl carrier protein
MTEEFLAILRGHLRYFAEDEPLAPDSRLKELGLDSMAATNLMIDLEDRFEITLDDQDLVTETFATAENLWRVVERARARLAAG